MNDKQDKSRSDQHVQTVCLVTLTAFAVAFALYLLQSVLVPFVLAVFFVYAIAPLVEYLQRRLKLPRGIAIVATFVLLFTILTVMGTLISSSIYELRENAGVYQARVEGLMRESQKKIDHWMDKLGIHDDGLQEDQTDNKDNQPQIATNKKPVEIKTGTQTQPTIKPFKETDATVSHRVNRAITDKPEGESLLVSDENGDLDLVAVKKIDSDMIINEQVFKLPLSKLRYGINRIVNEIIGILSNGILVLIFVLFLLLGGSKKTKPQTGIWAEVQSSIRQYLVTKFAVSAVTGILTTLVLKIFGVDLALVFGVLAFFLNFIPSIGSMIATVLPLPMLILNPEFTVLQVVGVMTILGAVQFALGNVIEPRLMGKSLDLHPIAVLLTLMFWGMIWGVVGMFLATPMTAVAKLLMERFEMTRPIANLLAGRLDEIGQGEKKS